MITKPKSFSLQHLSKEACYLPPITMKAASRKKASQTAKSSQETAGLFFLFVHATIKGIAGAATKKTIKRGTHLKKALITKTEIATIR